MALGHGRPKRGSALPGAVSWPSLLRLVVTACFWAGLAAAAVPAWGESLRLQLSWGGGRPERWHGEISLSEGAIRDPRPLGVEADQPGSMWLEGERLRFHEPSPRSYNGVELTASGPLDAQLRVTIASADGEDHHTEIPLEELVDGHRTIQLEDSGNRLFLHRAPGDMLRVHFERASLVFEPGETLEITVEPHLLPVDAGTKVAVTISTVPARGSNHYWSTTHTIVAGQSVPIEQAVVLPEQEGAYDILITATYTPGIRLPQPRRLLSVGGGSWSDAGRVPLGIKQTVAKRRVQVVVIDPHRQPPETPRHDLSVVEQIDPANPTWWQRLTRPPGLAKFPRLWKGPLSSGHARAVEHPLGQLMQLGPAGKPGEVAWEAYTIPIDRPGRPYVLELSYPDDVPQTLAISIIEPNPAGAVYPLGVDSGIDQSEQLAAGDGPPDWRHHRIIFWPRTKSPIVLLVNGRPDVPALFGPLRVLGGWDHLPPSATGPVARPRRLWAAYMARPLVPENFSASEARGAFSTLGMDDWVTFYQGGVRLVEYLRFVGYDGLMLAVLADGSTIYPSQLLEPTPRYDTGVFLDEAQDPVRKDGVEMLLRLFERDGLQLIPALEFASPLPALEALLREAGPGAEGIRLVGPAGMTWTEAHRPVRGLAPYYNPLHPRVQEAMLAVVDELVQRYARHAAFSGLALQLTAHGYAQLPGPEWGLDDGTIARFEEDTGIHVPGNGPARFAVRAEFLVPQGQRPRSRAQEQWLTWRAEQLSRFYEQIHRTLKAVRPDARLYLAGTYLFSDLQTQRMLRRYLGQPMSMADALMQVGIDPEHYRRSEGIVLLRPERVTPAWSLAQRAVDLGSHHLANPDEAFRAREPGSLFFHPPQPLRIPSFDRLCPFQPCYTWLATQAVPAGLQNRRRFIHALAAMDPVAIFDGGWQIPLGQESTVRRLMEVFHRLPPEPMKPVAEPEGRTTQPVTLRVGTWKGKTYACLVNDASFPVTARLRVGAPDDCQVVSLDDQRTLPPLAQRADGRLWTVPLEPYDLVAAAFSSDQVSLAVDHVTWPAEVEARLMVEIDELDRRMKALTIPRLATPLENPGFEDSSSDPVDIPGWVVSSPPGTSVVLDPNQRHGGARSVRMASVGPVATLLSHPFPAPRTGMLMIWVALRCSDPNRQPPLRVALVGQHDGNEFVRMVHAGQIPGAGPPLLHLRSDWQWHPVLVNDLPLEGLSALQIRFDLMGPGEVWIDELLLQDLWFSPAERMALFKMIAPAKLKLQKGEVRDCLALLDSYWPRFLKAHVTPLDASPTEAPQVSRPPAHTSQEARSAGLLDRLRGLLRF
ncbi:MAG TPA: hypothetical protein EYH34_09175 [Planctomycetes bacterium]|nr:hypothetical protein [Planctomycetota bacterium]